MNTPTRKEGNSANQRRTPYHNKRRSSSGCFAPFKSPASTTKNSSRTLWQNGNKIDLAKEVLTLKNEIEKADEEIDSLEKTYSEIELQQHIDKLHEYNEIKDVAQMLIGKLAEMENKTTKELYTDFGLDIED